MNLARVIGTLVATIKSPGLEGIKFLVVQPLDKHQQAIGKAIIAADGVAMAGRGDIVTIVASREATMTLPERFVPIDDAITSIVDDVVV